MLQWNSAETKWQMVMADKPPVSLNNPGILAQCQNVLTNGNLRFSGWGAMILVGSTKKASPPCMLKTKLFATSFIVTVCVLLTVIYVHRSKRPVSPALNQLTGSLFVTSQLTPENVSALRFRGIQNIVDLRPDGEATDQAPSSEIQKAAAENGMSFHYIPVPHGPIPKDAVDELNNVLSGQTARTVLYCRTGKRAVRTFALMEASQMNGPNVDAILRMVHNAGFSADDLKENINQRIAKRNSNEEIKK